jgi:hypothetical protein
MLSLLLISHSFFSHPLSFSPLLNQKKWFNYFQGTKSFWIRMGDMGYEGHDMTPKGLLTGAGVCMFGCGAGASAGCMENNQWQQSF